MLTELLGRDWGGGVGGWGFSSWEGNLGKILLLIAKRGFFGHRGGGKLRKMGGDTIGGKGKKVRVFQKNLTSLLTPETVIVGIYKKGLVGIWRGRGGALLARCMRKKGEKRVGTLSLLLR